MNDNVNNLYNMQCKMCSACFLTDYPLVDFCSKCEDEVMLIIKEYNLELLLIIKMEAMCRLKKMTG